MSRRTRILLFFSIGIVAVVALGLVLVARNLEPRLHQWVTTSLSESLESDIQLGSVSLNWFPFQLRARDLIVRHHGRVDVPPLLVVSSFTADLQASDLWSSTVDRVTVDGLEINIPPRDTSTGKRPFPTASSGSTRDSGSSGLIVRHLIATNARMAIVPRESGKNAKVWDIFQLEMKNLRSGEPATFTAALINPIPYGRIESTGTFGPWQSNEPGTSALSGSYTFAADLGTIAGLAGRLEAEGAMDGTIERIATKGTTSTPDFRLTELDGIALPLITSYDALVDGTKGDVELHTVDIMLGRSRLKAHGTVLGTKGIKGKRVVVKVTSPSTDLGELLRFVSKAANPAAQGTLIIDAAMDLPQGQEKVLERVSLQGSVRAERVHFTNSVVQDKIDLLSRRAQGRPGDDSIDDVASRMATRFTLKNGVFAYRGLSFDVKGASVKLDGTHSLRSKAVDLSGVVLLNATVSQTQMGYRSWLLKPFDPLFRKNGAGTRLAITVAGTQDQPKVGLEVGRTLRGR